MLGNIYALNLRTSRLPFPPWLRHARNWELCHPVVDEGSSNPGPVRGLGDTEWVCKVLRISMAS